MSRDSIEPPSMERSSSFARSFFESGMDEQDEKPPPLSPEELQQQEQQQQQQQQQPDPQTMMPPTNRTSLSSTASTSTSSTFDSPGRRRRSRRVSRASMDGSQLLAPVTAARNSIQEEGEASADLAAAARPVPQRQSSWVSDALAQSGNDSLTAILGQVQNETANHQQDPHLQHDEVLEQYRVMAHIEAEIRVKDNTGFDMTEYEKRRKMQPETKTEEERSKQLLKPKLVDFKRPNETLAARLLPQVPPELSKYKPRPQPRVPRQPDLSVGTMMPHSSSSSSSSSVVVAAPEGQHLVQCLGCQQTLAVHLYATLVKCPECATVSPATSMRR